jgi:hypothetical protein
MVSANHLCSDPNDQDLATPSYKEGWKTFDLTVFFAVPNKFQFLLLRNRKQILLGQFTHCLRNIFMKKVVEIKARLNFPNPKIQNPKLFQHQNGTTSGKFHT